jgi:predicted kinase
MPNGTCSKPRLIVLVGLPGSGKSTWAERQGYTVLSSDVMRGLLIDDPANQNIHGRVFGALRYLLRHRMELQRPVTCLDATNLTRRDRKAWIKMAELYGCVPEAVFLDVPVEECLRRNAARGRMVPEEAIRMMAAKLAVPTVEEGFQSVTVIRP